MADVDVSLDRISLVGGCPDAPDLQRYMRDRLEVGDVVSDRTFYDSHTRARRVWQTADGVNVSLTLRIPTCNLDWWECSPEDENPFRLEWNPNRANPDAIAWFMDHPRPTRLDVALDYEGVNIEDYTYARPHVAASRFWDAASDTTGVQLGRRGSGRYAVVYDKAKELGIQGATLTRFEMRSQLRPKDEPLSERLFDGVRAFRSEIPASVNPEEASRLALLLHYPEHFARFDKRTKRHYRELASELCGELAPHPEAVYLQGREELQDMVHDLKAGLPVRRAKVYEMGVDEEVGNV